MKFGSTIVLAVAGATAVLAAPKPQEDGGHGVPPPATVSSTTISETITVTPKPTNTEVPDDKKQPDIKIPYSTTNALFTMTPADADSWGLIKAPGVFNETAHFAIKNQDKAGAKFAPPHEFAGVEVWMYQRSDGGVASLLIDGVALARLDYYNKTAGKDDAPVKVYENPNIRRAHHVLEFRNLEDPRVKKFGQFNIDHVTITAAADVPNEEAPPTTSAPETATETAPGPQETPPLTAPTAEEESQTTPPPDNFAPSLSTPKVFLSAAALIAAAFALF